MKVPGRSGGQEKPRSRRGLLFLLSVFIISRWTKLDGIYLSFGMNELRVLGLDSVPAATNKKREQISFGNDQTGKPLHSRRLEGGELAGDLLGLVGADGGSETDGDPVPGVNGGDGERQGNDVFFRIVACEFFVDIVWSVALLDVREGLGPGKGRTFGVSEERSFAPGVQGVEALFGFAGGSSVLGVHVDAEGATVHLGSTGFQEMDELVIQAAITNEVFQFVHALDGLGGGGAVVD